MIRKKLNCLACRSIRDINSPETECDKGFYDLSLYNTYINMHICYAIN